MITYIELSVTNVVRLIMFARICFFEITMLFVRLKACV